MGKLSEERKKVLRESVEKRLKLPTQHPHISDMQMLEYSQGRYDVKEEETGKPFSERSADFFYLMNDLGYDNKVKAAKKLYA